MNWHKTAWLAFITLLVIGLQIASGGPEDAPVPPAAKDHWLRDSTRTFCLSGTMTVETIKSDKGNTQKSVAVRKIKLTPDAALLEVPAESPKSVYKVFCANQRYAFVLSRSEPTADYLLAAYSDNKDETFTRHLPSPVRDEVVKSVTASYIAGDVPIAMLLDPREYLIERVAASPDRAGATRLTFRQQAAPTTSKGCALNGWVDADPAQGWAMVGGEFARDVGRKQTITFYFQTTVKDSTNGFPLPQERKVWAAMKKPDGSQTSLETRITYDLTEQRSLPEADFTLSAFGLPEPPGVAWSKPTPRYLWWLGGAMICGIAAIIFYRLSRRRSAAS